MDNGTNTKISKAQQQAVHRYVRNHYDRIGITVPKGMRDLIKALADYKKTSVNLCIRELIEASIEFELENIMDDYLDEDDYSLRMALYRYGYQLVGESQIVLDELKTSVDSSEITPEEKLLVAVIDYDLSHGTTYIMGSNILKIGEKAPEPEEKPTLTIADIKTSRPANTD